METFNDKEARAKYMYHSLNESRKIDEQNRAQVLKLNATNLAADFNKELNRRMADEYSKEVLRTSQIELNKATNDFMPTLSTLSMNEGITGGASKGRQVQVASVKASEKLGEKIQATESIFGKLANQLEADSQALELQKKQAYETMLQNTTFGSNRALQIHSAGLKGYAEGLSTDFKTI